MFTRKYGLNRWNVNTVKWNPEKSTLKPDWMVYLVRDYNISADWLLTGRGGMLRIV
jgi:hypothetical protein